MIIKSYTATPNCGLIFEYIYRQEDGSLEVHEQDIIGTAVVNHSSSEYSCDDEMTFCVLRDDDPVVLGVEETFLNANRNVYILGITDTAHRTTMETLHEMHRGWMERKFAVCGTHDVQMATMLATATQVIERSPNLYRDENTLIDDFLREWNQEDFIPRLSETDLKYVAKGAFEFKQLKTDQVAA